MALRIRRAWYFAYLVFEVMAGSASVFHIESISRNVEAAIRVSTVLLEQWVSIQAP
jgi:hypothetical protein